MVIKVGGQRCGGEVVSGQWSHTAIRDCVFVVAHSLQPSLHLLVRVCSFAQNLILLLFLKQLKWQK